MKTSRSLGLWMALVLAGCASEAPIASQHSDLGQALTLSAGQSVILAGGQRANAPSSFTVTQPGGGTLKNIGHRITVSATAGALVSVPNDATGPADNLIIATAVPPATPASASTVAWAADPKDKAHWESFLQLARKPDAAVTVHDVERAFGQKAIPVGQGYAVAGVVRLAPSGLVFFDMPNVLMAESCMPHSRAIRDLQVAGWSMHSHDVGKAPQGDIREPLPPDAPYGSYTFLKGDQGVVLLGYSEKTGCATALTMESNKAEFDRVSNAR